MIHSLETSLHLYRFALLHRISLDWYINETANHHRHIFLPLALQQIPFRRMKAFFQKISPTANFYNFSKLKIFLVLAENPQFRWENRHSYEMIPFDTHSAANMPPVTILKKIQVLFDKTHLLFLRKKPKLRAF